LPDLGLLATSNAEGRFLFNRVGAGTHTVVVRTRDGGEAKAEGEVPGSKLDLVVGPARTAK
jgi:hypothetical protein